MTRRRLNACALTSPPASSIGMRRGVNWTTAIGRRHTARAVIAGLSYHRSVTRNNFRNILSRQFANLSKLTIRERFKQNWDRWCYAFGAVFIILWLLGTMNIIDFHICVKGPGECPW